MWLHPFNLLWVLLALPGFALLRRARRAWLDQGVFAALSASYAATFVLLSPLAIAGYWFAWPVRVLAVGVLVSMAVALADLGWHFRELRALPRPSLLGVLVLA